MIFGPDAYTAIHSLISLATLVAGSVVLITFLRGDGSPFWEALFLATAILTDVTGFGFTADRILPSHVTGVISLVALAVALWARYGAGLAGAARWIYVAGVAFAFYLDAFVAVVQAFGKIDALKALAPTQTEPIFLLVQAIVLFDCVFLGVLASRRFRPAVAA
jgi:hypothetical protein